MNERSETYGWAGGAVNSLKRPIFRRPLRLNDRSGMSRVAAMSLSMPVVWTDRHRLHEPGAEIWVGVSTPGTEVPERADRIRVALEERGARVVAATEHPDSALLAVHDSDLVDYLFSAWEAWRSAGLPEDPGQDRVVPYIFPGPGWAADPAAATNPTARAGQFAYDTMTLIGPGTWEAARAGADAALTAVDLVATGGRAAYACTRPPGHHAARNCFGGSCYLNNAAIAAAAMFDVANGGPVAVIDIDAHHGNGTQQIFYDDPGVLTGSVHVDPGAGWFPHLLGFANEVGTGLGAATNRNIPLPPGSGDEPWLAAVGELAAWAQAGGARSLVIALGVDAAGGDPESPLEVSSAGYSEAGRILGGLELPTVIVQEGGYDLATIGALVAAFLEGFVENC
jgi:acetoin utilization deacetylase AcuC-like enzyme